MSKNRRHMQLLKFLADRNNVTVDELADHLTVSPATVSRDVNWLAERKMLVRSHGRVGVVRVPNPLPPLASTAFQIGMDRFSERKRAIARRAAQMCKDGDTIIVNGGSTTFMMAEFLTERRLQVLTNSFRLAQYLVENSDSEVFLPGGSVYRAQNLVLSPFDDDITQHYYAQTLFMGIHGVSSLGVMEADALVIKAMRELQGQAKHLVVLADSSKFANKAGMVLCGLQHVACFVTDTDAPDGGVQMLERAGIKVLTVAPELQPQNNLTGHDCTKSTIEH